MQYKVADTNAITFSRNFYRTLAAHQSIDEAVTAGRLAILTGSSEEVEFDWAVPVLYLRADEEQGILFPAATDGEQPTDKPDASSPGSITKTPPPSDTVDPRALRTGMIPNFSREELEILCADVEADLRQDGIAELVNLEIVGGSGIPAIVLKLIKHMERRKLLPYLVKAVRNARPGLI